MGFFRCVCCGNLVDTDDKGASYPHENREGVDCPCASKEGCVFPSDE